MQIDQQVCLSGVYLQNCSEGSSVDLMRQVVMVALHPHRLQPVEYSIFLMEEGEGDCACRWIEKTLLQRGCRGVVEVALSTIGGLSSALHQSLPPRHQKSTLERPSLS